MKRFPLAIILLWTALAVHSPAQYFNSGWHLEARNPNHVFLQPDPAVFEASGGSMPIDWLVEDWLGNDAGHGTFLVTPTAPLQLPNLDPGYYTLYYDKVTPGSKPNERSPSVSFAQLVDPGSRKTGDDCPYALDTAQSWLARPRFNNNPFQPANAFEVVSDLAKWAGVKQVRDRISWADTNPGPGSFNWGRADINADLLAQRGIKVLQVFHDAPQWTKSGTKAIPSDLIALYNFTRTAAQHFKGRVTAWEFWNEPDGAYCPDPAWEFAAAMKAAFIGFTDGDPSAKVLIASDSSSPVALFYDLVLQNGTGPYFDVFNFHFYRPVGDFNWVMKNKEETLLKNQIRDKLMWMTEFGVADEGKGRRMSLIPGGNLLEHDALQELQQADFLVKGFITAQSFGIERSFYYVLPPMNEQHGAKVWGLLRWDWTVKPAYAALSNLTYQLGGMIYRGQINAGKGVTAHLFQTPLAIGSETPATQTMVAWAENERAVQLPSDDTKFSVVDLMGRPSTITGHALVASTTPIYITGLHNLQPDIPLMRPSQIRRQSTKIDFKSVLSLHFGPEVRISKRTAIELAPGQLSTGALWVYNFSNVPKAVRLKAAVDGVELQGLPSQIIVPPFNSAKSAFTLMKAAGAKEGGRILVSGASDAGEITPALVPVK